MIKCEYGDTEFFQAISGRYPAIKITDADYAVDLALFVDKLEYSETLLHYLQNKTA